MGITADSKNEGNIQVYRGGKSGGSEESLKKLLCGIGELAGKQKKAATEDSSWS